jgi:hypothetical protein
LVLSISSAAAAGFCNIGEPGLETLDDFVVPPIGVPTVDVVALADMALLTLAPPLMDVSVIGMDDISARIFAFSSCNLNLLIDHL